MKLGLFLLAIISLLAARTAAGIFDPIPEIKREILVRPENINVSVKQQEFKDTTLNLKAKDNIRIRIKVKNGNFFNIFA